MSTALAHLPSLNISLGSGGTGVFDAGLPVLAGAAVEALFGEAEPAGRSGAFALFRRHDWLVGAAMVESEPDLEAITHRLYGDIFGATEGLHLARVWNYVPAINEPGPDGLENYQSFCRGRSLAFEQQFGQGFKAQLPASSAVGNTDAGLIVVFAACESRPRHVENPLQVPAYDYPLQYGPRPPSFARATLVPGPGRTAVFISGTAAVRGHLTVEPESTQGQLTCTLENLRELSLACDLGPDLGAGRGLFRHFKIYLRYAADQPAVAAALNRHLLRPDDTVSYLLADICRASLNVEIEATLLDGDR